MTLLPFNVKAAAVLLNWMPPKAVPAAKLFVVAVCTAPAKISSLPADGAVPPQLAPIDQLPFGAPPPVQTSPEGGGTVTMRVTVFIDDWLPAVAVMVSG